ncbi:hypothetical protein ACWEU6_09995 [Streptosporangium sandarakinum]
MIDEMLRADLDAPRKQRHTARRIFDRLVGEYGADEVSYQMVRRYVADRRGEIWAEAGRGPSNAFVPQSYRPGVEAEVDFGDVTVRLAGEQVRCWLFAFRLSYSGKAVHCVFASGGQEAFFEQLVAGLAAALRAGALTADAVALEARKAGEDEERPPPARDEAVLQRRERGSQNPAAEPRVLRAGRPRDRPVHEPPDRPALRQHGRRPRRHRARISWSAARSAASERSCSSSVRASGSQRRYSGSSLVMSRVPSHVVPYVNVSETSGASGDIWQGHDFVGTPRELRDSPGAGGAVILSGMSVASPEGESMGKARSLAVTAALATGLTLSAGTAPAQADSIRYVYYLYSDCVNGGSLGIQWGWWTSYTCVYTETYGPKWALWA